MAALKASLEAKSTYREKDVGASEGVAWHHERLCA